MSVARLDLADDPGTQVEVFLQGADDRGGVKLGDDQDHADPHVEDAEHLSVGHLAKLLKPGEDRRYVPLATDSKSQAFRQNAGWIIEKSASGDVGDPVDNLLDAVLLVDGF